MFRIILIFLILTKAGFAAAGAGASRASDYSSMRESIDYKITSGDNLILILGSNPFESEFDKKRPFLYTDSKIYTLGNSPAEAGKYDESRHFHVDFNNPGQMKAFAKAFRGSFKTIAFDLSVLKFFKEWDNLQYIKELLMDDGTFYIPQPAHNYAIISSYEGLISPALLAEKPSYLGGNAGQAWKKRIAPELDAKTLEKTTQNLTTTGFAFKIIKEHEVTNPLLKDLFAKSAARRSMAEQGEDVIDVLVATKEDVRRSSSRGSSPTRIAAKYSRSASRSPIRSSRIAEEESTEAAVSAAASGSASGVKGPPYTVEQASKIVEAPSADWKNGGIVKASNVNTDDSAYGSPVKTLYNIRSTVGWAYVLEGFFYSRIDLSNKILAAETLRVKASMGRENFGNKLFSDMSDRYLEVPPRETEITLIPRLRSITKR